MNLKTKGILPALAAALSFLATACTETLPQENWNDGAYKALTSILANYGKGTPGHAGAYAVFDFDNTTIINDITLVTCIYQIENLRFKIKPEDMYSTMLNGIPFPAKELAGLGGRTAIEMAGEISADYKYLYDNYISDVSASLEDIHKTSQYLDFRAKIWALDKAIDADFESSVGLLWIINFFEGMTHDELARLVRDAADYSLEIGGIVPRTWMSPDGKTSVEVETGAAITGEMKDLYKALMNEGIDVYICSASLEEIVETVACDPRYGFNMRPENVYGLRMASNDKGTIHAEYAPDYIQPIENGKTELIKERIAPSHDGNDPVLICGDSNGDYSMLTSFYGMHTGLIVDCNRSGNIASLVRKAESSQDTKYVVQKRNASEGTFITY